MQDLRVIGVENGALLVVSDDGTRFRIPIDEVLHSRIRQSSPEPGSGRKISPREIQSHIRAGMSAADVAAITGASLEYIQKFEGPVLAEREFVVDSALAVPVITADESDPFTHGISFGAAITQRLHTLSAINVRWASWKEEGSGWIVKLAFTADQVDHDARWTFDPRKHALSPLNSEAKTLSQQGELPGAMIPRLRAVGASAGTGSVAAGGSGASGTGKSGREPDASRFDSGAFDMSGFGGGAPEHNLVHSIDETDSDHASESVESQQHRFAASSSERESNQTADLLDALRRRRGERESASFGDEEDAENPSSRGSGIRLVDVPLESYLETDSTPPAASPLKSSAQQKGSPQQKTSPQPTVPQPNTAAKGRKGRVSMPSWDDIVFGARPDDDPA